MKIKENILEVPEKAVVRNTLRKAARALVAERGLLPPADFTLISQMAGEVISSTNTESRFTEFAMVVCGNEIWRPIVAATPYNRRLLLLPQCLKNNSSCNAVIDQLGLICAGCQGCQIDSILQKAESLGYATLVAEGTTVAVSLVQEGSIDAVIGVSCMSVLQKSFEPVSRAAVPVIGIPLLFEGCASTDVDNFWLNEEMVAYKENDSFRTISVSALKEKVKLFFSEEILVEAFGNETDKTSQMAIQSMLTGGQRIRPLLTALAYSAYSAAVSEELMSSLAVVVECFHKASLIHDDVEDNDDFRYDTETIHKLNGTAVAINTGDYLLGKGYELLGKLPVTPSKMAACYQLVSLGHVSLSLGQGADLLASSHRTILPLGQQLDIFERKTGSAIRVALLLGAVAADVPNEDLEVLKTFSGFFGMAYQIKDDLDEFREAAEQTQPADYPLLLSLLVEDSGLSTDTIQLLYRENKREEITQLILEKQVDKKAEELLREFTQKAYRELDKLENLKMKLSLYTVLGKIF
ncbi:MAG TPA: polyprenyl synthetase family protein [Prolixibacteraceae bacterium]|nr:polyprenyl synthetase family protein [Prolixibacteraceae bacterium]